MRRNILTSDLGFARGICGDAAVYFDQLDPVDIADKLICLENDNRKREALKLAGFARLEKFDDFEERARRYLEIIIR